MQSLIPAVILWELLEEHKTVWIKLRGKYVDLYMWNW